MLSRPLLALLVLCSCVPLLAAARAPHAYPGDDPLITLTYAKNLAAGNGFVFNAGEPTLGTTTPLWALVLAAAMAALPGVSGTAIATWSGAACWIGWIWSFYGFREAFGLDGRAVGWIAATLAAAGWTGFLGMEAYPFALLATVTAGLALRGAAFSAGVAAGCLFLVRGEGALFAGIATALAWWAARGAEPPRRLPALAFPPARLALGFVLPLGLWSLYALPAFGNVFPNTLAAKIAQVESGLWPGFVTRLVHDWLPRWRVGPTFGAWWVHLGWPLVAFGLARTVRAFPRMLVFPLWALAYAAGYAALGAPGYPWYRLPLEAAWLLALALAAEGIAARIGEGARSPLRRVAAVLPGLLVVAALAPPTWRAIVAPTVAAKDRAYRELAAWLDGHARAGDRVAYMEIGYLGYYTRLGVVDLVGLVSPEITARVASRDFTSGFWEAEPEYLVALEGSRFTDPLLADPRFAPRYERAVRLDGFDGHALTVFRERRSVEFTDEPTGDPS